MTRRRDLPPRPDPPVTDSAGAVLRAILDHGPVARSSVARATRLSAASVSGLVTSLVREGLVREVPEAAGPPGTGRPHVPVDIEPDAPGVIGVHIAVAHTTVARLDLRGRVLEQRQEPHGRRDPASVLGSLRSRIAGLAQGRRLLGIGVATGGWVDAANGVLVEHHLLGWHRVPLAAVLADATGLPVGIDSNSRALLKAEQLFGRAASGARRSAVHLFVGSVVDVAFSANGIIHQGPRSAAGTVAHLPIEGCDATCACGRTGCLQAAVSDQTLVRRFGTGRADVRTVLDAATRGDRRATRLLLQRARTAGRAAGLLFDLFDPEVMIVTEAALNRFPNCLAALREEAGEAAAEVIRPTSFPGDVLAVAGGAVALDRVYAAPLSPVPART
ncbi:ROK family protein [Actinoplanes sp. NPDC051343]|uniref:ROK family transcriptional regulator n=1 Tax=Actinoplanes sp. NPDC051343 TaxID=3363906 RepID=UPI0037958424